MILGIDPGLASTGFAVVSGRVGRLTAVECGTLRTAPRMSQSERLLALHDGVCEILGRHEVAAAAIEAWFVHPVSRAAMGMAEARGAILVALARAALPVAEYAPNEVKQAVTGNGRAEKDQVRAMVGRLASGFAGGSHHAADALAIAICHLHQAPLAAAIRRAE